MVLPVIIFYVCALLTVGSLCGILILERWDLQSLEGWSCLKLEIELRTRCMAQV